MAWAYSREGLNAICFWHSLLPRLLTANPGSGGDRARKRGSVRIIAPRHGVPREDPSGCGESHAAPRLERRLVPSLRDHYNSPLGRIQGNVPLSDTEGQAMQ